MEIVYLVVGLLLGAIAALFFFRTKFSAELIAEREKSSSFQREASNLKSALETERNKSIETVTRLATSEADYRNLQEKLIDQKKELESLNTKFSNEFKNLANEIFEEKSKKFTDQNKTNLFDLLNPLKEKIGEFEKKVEDANKDSLKQNSALREQLDHLQKASIQMTEEAENLTKALKGDSQVQGAWGELILETILEKSGLEKDREYIIQESVTTSEGKRLRPDIIVKLPENRKVIIDSKMSLVAYSNFVNSETEEQKAAALKAHLLSVRQHMKLLADKEYQKNVTDNGLDFVIMFIPIEPAYLLAIQNEKNLYEEALAKRIVFVSPTLLIPSLQLIKNSWKQEYRNKHTQELIKQVTDLYEKFKGFTDDLIKVGVQLKNSQNAYEDAMNKLSTGHGNLVRRAESLKKFGISTSKNIDQRLLDKSADQPDSIELKSKSI